MTTTDTQTQQLVINRLTKTQFASATPSSTELWAVDPEFAGSKLLATDANGDIVESSIASNVTIPTKTSDLNNDSGFITSSALSGYATETWVGQQGYITGITSAMVTTALGYTPYDASNPNGYTSNAGTVTSVNNVSPVNGNVTLSIPTVNDSTITIQKNGTTVDSFTTNASSNKSINITVPTSAADVSALPASTKYGADLSYSSNTLQLKDQDGNNLGSAVTISGGGSLPSQTGQSGKFLTTDGTDASWASIPSDSSKLDTDFSNMNPSSSAKGTIVGWGMPDYSSGVSKTSGTEYTATTNGWLEIWSSCYNSNTTVKLTINSTTKTINSGSTNNHLNNAYAIIPVNKNDIYKVEFARTEASQYINFYPCVGG